MIRILASDGMQADAVKALEAKGFEVTQQFYEPDQLAEEVKNYDVMVVRSATKVRQPIIDAALETGRLKLVIRGGVGVDNIDCAYAEAKGIKVTNTPRSSSASVAELALAHMFALARFVGISNVTMRNGEWNKKKYEGVELNGKTLGLIGMAASPRSWPNAPALWAWMSSIPISWVRSRMSPMNTPLRKMCSNALISSRCISRLLLMESRLSPQQTWR